MLTYLLSVVAYSTLPPGTSHFNSLVEQPIPTARSLQTKLNNSSKHCQPQNMGEATGSTAAQSELVDGMAHRHPPPVSTNGPSFESPATRLQHLSLSAQTIHADDYLNSHQAVAPPMHVSTTFRYSSNPDELRAADENVGCLCIASLSS